MMLIPPNKNAIDISIILSNVAVNVILVKKVEKHEVRDPNKFCVKPNKALPIRQD